MKYLWQQMIAFGAVILMMIVLASVIFLQFTKQTLQETAYDQMINYAKSIEQNSIYNNDHELERILPITQAVLSQQDVSFIYIDAQYEIKYPQDVAIDLSISKDLWEQLHSGKVIKILQKFNLKEDQDVSVATVFYPLMRSKADYTSPAYREFDGVLVVLQPVSYIDASIEMLLKDFMKAAVFAIFVSLILSYLFARFQVGRINKMRRATKEIASGKFDVYVDSQTRDELGELAADFNQMAQSLKEYELEIKRQEERRKQFMADAAHEMRTPLTTINGLLEGLAYQAIPEDQQEKCIQLMQDETKRLIRLVNENLDYEKIRTNQISMHKYWFDATDTLRMIVGQLENKAEAEGNQLTLHQDQSVQVYADYDRFVQIIVNIVQNAIQFTEQGKIDLYLTWDDVQYGTCIQISDTGIGMTEDQMKNIWDRYYKVDPSRKNTKYGESGLGLAIVHQLVKLHQGTISVDSQLGEGTTFSLFFPGERKSHESL